jgi:hypothetical protein
MQRAAAVVLFFFAATVQADPGHGIADLWHLLTQPDHLAMILLPLAIVVGIRARKSKKGTDPIIRK